MQGQQCDRQRQPREEALTAIKHYGADGSDDYLAVSQELSKRDMDAAALEVLDELLEKWRGSAAGCWPRAAALHALAD